MSEYFDEQSDLNQLNKLIDNDKSINKDIFRRQLITDFLEFKKGAEEYSKTINNDETTIYNFYEFLKQFLINKNDLVTTVAHYNIEEKYGTNNVISQFEALENTERKNHEVNKTSKPDSIIETKRKEIEVNKFNKEKEDRIIDEKIRKIEYYLSYKKSTSYDTCELYFEATKVITNWLDSYNMGFQSLKKVRDVLLTLNQTNPTEFNKLYDDFEKIYTGDMYISKNITELFNTTQSFRINMLMLHTRALIYITNNVKTKVSWENTIYKDFKAYYKIRLSQLKTAYPTMTIYPQFNNVWPTNIVKNDIDVGYSTEHLLLIYIHILKPDMIKYRLKENVLKDNISKDYIKLPFIPTIEKTDEPADVYNQKVSDDSTNTEPVVETKDETGDGLFSRIKPTEQ
jgi:hypothetical protein